MGPEFNEKLQWARYLQLQHDEERRKEKVRIARIEEERKKEEENKDIENKYMNYEVEEQEEKPRDETRGVGRRMSEEDEYEKVILYADGAPYQVVDLKDLEHMSEEEYINRLKDSWSKEIHYKDIEELTLSKYYNYEVEEQEEKPRDETDWPSVIFRVTYWGILIGILIFAIVKVFNGG